MQLKINLIKDMEILFQQIMQILRKQVWLIKQRFNGYDEALRCHFSMQQDFAMCAAFQMHERQETNGMLIMERNWLHY